MRKLLEELAEIDAKTYEKISFACMDAFEGHTPESMLDDSPNDEVEIVCDLIQGACQRVIAARGWQVVMLSAPDHARVVIEEFTDGMGGTRKIVEFEASSPAKAILSAYISAIRSQP
jgi:hypothetical protein